MNDFVPAPNLARHPEVYELENQAIARDGRLQRALRNLADWAGLRLLDIGTGTGFWLPTYSDATRVVGVEPDPALLARAAERVEGLPHVSAISGSAEHLPLEDASIDVAHARWAYFFGEGAERGLAEVRRVLAPGGTFVAVDNSWTHGHFADLLRDAQGGNASMDPDRARNWWEAQGAERIDLDAAWEARSPAELERILRIEFPEDTVDRFLTRHRRRRSLTYAIALYVVRG